MPEYKNIRIREDAFEMLKRNKPEGVTWTHYLEQLQHETDNKETTK